MYNIYIKIGGVALKLPINPDDIKIVYETSYNKYDIIGLGEIELVDSEKLSEVVIESFLPSANTNLITNSNISNNTFIDKCKYARKNNIICEFIIKRDTLKNLSMNCVITKVEVEERGGEVGDIYYKLNLLQHRNSNPIKIRIKQTPPISLSVPVNQTASQYIAEVNKDDSTKDNDEKEVIKEEGEKDKPTEEITKGDIVRCSGYAYYTANGFMGLKTTHTGESMKVENIDLTKAKPYKIKPVVKASWLNLSTYTTKDKLSKF